MNARNALLTAILIICGTGMTGGKSQAAHEDHTGHSHDDHAYGPIGVMGDHTHPDGARMISYRYMFMEMNGNRDGSDRISASEVLEDFPVSPTDMNMWMHMLGGMWAPTDEVTLMLMLPHVRNEMDHVTRMGGTFTTESEGVGDLKAAALINSLQWGCQKIHINAGVSFPTGSIDEKDETPMGRVRLPYPMQIGSGTFDLHPGLTYLGQRDGGSWGGQISGTVHLGENDNDYTLGDRICGTTWAAYKWCEWFSSSLRVEIENWKNISGADSRLDPTLVPTADPDRRGGTQVDLGLGGNLLGQTGVLKGHRLAVEWEWPIYRDLDGPQLETDWVLTVGWQKTW